MISGNPNLGLQTRAGQPIKDGFHIRLAGQCAMGTIAQPASQSTMDTILQLASQFTAKLLLDQLISLHP
jgi:hypothetical protein